jgi:lipopolysaccharide transport system permease protein
MYRPQEHWPMTISNSSRDNSADTDLPDFRWYTPHTSYLVVDLRALWDARELIWTFTLRDVKVRYRQTLIGVLWAVLQPLLPLVIFVTMFGLLGKQPVQEGVPYHVVALCGLVVWQLFGTGVTSASACLVSYRHLITKVYFPRLVLPISALLSSLVDFVCAASLILILGAQYVVPPSPAILVAPFFVLLAFLASLACGIWLSALNGLYRDFGYLAPFLLQMGFFLSPVVYQTEGLIPPRWQLLFAFNPLVGAIEGFRWSVIGQGDFPWFAIAPALLSTGVLLVSGLLCFRYVDRFLTDRI